MAVLLWVPDAYRKGDIWLQFERRNAQGQPTGIPISVAVGSDAGPSTRLPQRPGLQARVAAVPLGGYFLSRWVAAIEPARSAISSWIGWGFEVEAGQAVHMGRLELSLQPVQVQGQEVASASTRPPQRPPTSP